MKKLVYLIVVTLIIGLVLTGCSLLPNVGQVPNTEQKYNENNPNPNEFALGDLVAGQNIKVGTVTVSNDADNLYVTYKTDDGWEITETHLAVANSLEEIPQTKKFNPIPGKFPYSSKYDLAVTEYTYTIPLEDGDTDLYIATHAKVEKQIDGGIIQEETAWGYGDDFNGANWATYSEYTVTQVPVLQFCVAGDGVSELTTEQAHSGIYSVRFHTDIWDWTNKYALGIPVDIPLNELTELSYWRNGLVYDYAPPAVLLCIDANDDGELDFDICDALSEDPSLMGDDAIFGIGSDWVDTGWTEVNGLTNSYWLWGGVFTVDKTGFYGDWVSYSSLQDFPGFGTIDPTDNVMLVVIAGGNPDGDVYIDDITVNGETYDLEPD